MFSSKQAHMFDYLFVTQPGSFSRERKIQGTRFSVMPAYFCMGKSWFFVDCDTALLYQYVQKFHLQDLTLSTKKCIS